jgi:hypothetical protein
MVWFKLKRLKLNIENHTIWEKIEWKVSNFGPVNERFKNN